MLFAGATVMDRLDAGTNGRAALWAGALRIVGAHPWLGIGPMHFAYVPTLGGAHPHNVVLQVAAEWGLPAAGLVVALGVGAGAAWLRHARRAADAPWAAGLTCALAAAVANGLVDGVVIAPVSQMVAALGVGALLAEALGPARGVPPRPVPPPAPWRGLALAAVALPAAAVLLAVAASDGPTLHRRGYDLRGAAVSAYDLPRFWSTGQIAGHLPPARARFWPDESAGGPPGERARVPEGRPGVPVPPASQKTDATRLRTSTGRRYPRPTPAASAALPASSNG